MKPAPEIPKGTSSLFTSAAENFSFHNSPEAFIAARILQHHKDHPESAQKREPVRAKILNRDVVILSSYHQIQQVLDPPGGGHETDGEEPPFVAVAPYDQLMAPFFPQPNLLLNDGPSHGQMKSSWQSCPYALSAIASSENLQGLIRSHLQSLPLSQPIDLYAVLKDLTWKIYLAVFLDLDTSDGICGKIVQQQEDLLRGQFSLMPVSVNVGFWHSPRKKGISARKDLQKVIEEVLATRRPAWLSGMPDTSPEELVNHTLMATSSLAVKATASFILAFLLNMFIYRPNQPEARSWSYSAEISAPEERRKRVDAVIQETLRLSPPIVGVMRRATSDQIIKVDDERQADILIPKGFDVWCYFPGANREGKVYGISDDQELLRPIRFHRKIRSEHHPPVPYAFGAGAKSCLGESFVRTLASTIYDVFASSGLELQGEVKDPGVKGWLGWAVATPDEWAKGVKQMPTQRPSEAVLVRMERTETIYHGMG